jgi:F-type H+-transporting ATPase subunit b
MLIDWFTVVAQIINFLILVWLMKRYLYKPILNAIDQREKSISAAIADSEAKKVAAQKEHDEFDRKNKEFDQSQKTRTDKAVAAAKALGDKLNTDAKSTADQLKAKLQKSIEDEGNQLRDSIGRRAQNEIFAIARKTLSDLAGVGLEEKIVEAFVRQLQELSEAAKTQLISGTDAQKSAAIVRSAFDLKPDQRVILKAAIEKQLGPNVGVSFETKPDLIGGIEMALGGQKISWAIADYLQSLESKVLEVPKPSSAAHGA